MEKTKSFIVEKVYYLVSIIAMAFVIIFLIFTFLFRTSVVNGDSMVPNLINGEKVLVSVFNYEPSQGDVVIISHTDSMEKNLVKRVIATAGQRVSVNQDEGRVYVDGVALDEPYISVPTINLGDWDYSDFDVPEGCVFVMGDNRNESLDSRYSQVGFVKTDYIVGHAVYKLNGYHVSEIKGTRR